MSLSVMDVKEIPADELNARGNKKNQIDFSLYWH